MTGNTHNLFLAKFALPLLILLLVQSNLYSQEKVVPIGTDGMTDTVDAVTGKQERPTIQDFDNKVTTFKIGVGFIYDFTTYAQSAVFKEQMGIANIELGPRSKTRDFRVLGSGVLK